MTICQNIVSLLGPYNRILCHSALGKGTKFWFYVYTDKTQFENNNTYSTKMKSSLEESFNDSEKNGNFTSYNLYSEFKISSNMNSENSKLIKTEEGSINEELEEYVDTLSSKKPFNSESEQIMNSPTAMGNQGLLSRLVEIDLKSPKKNRIKNLLLESPELRNNSPRPKRCEISPPIVKKILRKQLKNGGGFKPKTFDSIPNYSGFRCKRGFSMTKKSPKNKNSLFLKDSQFSSILYSKFLVICLKFVIFFLIFH